MTRALGWALAAALMGAGCALPKDPDKVFDAYVKAYADGDGARVWDLSSPRARLDARVWRLRLLAALTHPDPVQRIQVEGRFGVVASDLRGMDDRTFFLWLMAAIRKRVGGPLIRKTASAWHRVLVVPRGVGVVVIYRDGGSRQELPMVRVDGAWRVETSPFPAAKPPEKKDPPVKQDPPEKKDGDPPDEPEPPPRAPDDPGMT